MNTEALSWITGHDTGVSSKTIWAVLMDAVSDTGWYGTPSDGGDFGRCYRLLELVPAWRGQLDKVATRFPGWGPLVREWSRLEEAYRADLKDNGRRTYDLINSLRDEIYQAEGFHKISPGYWKRNERAQMRGKENQ